MGAIREQIKGAQESIDERSGFNVSHYTESGQTFFLLISCQKGAGAGVGVCMLRGGGDSLN